MWVYTLWGGAEVHLLNIYKYNTGHRSKNTPGSLWHKVLRIKFQAMDKLPLDNYCSLLTLGVQDSM